MLLNRAGGLEPPSIAENYEKTPPADYLWHRNRGIAHSDDLYSKLERAESTAAFSITAPLAPGSYLLDCGARPSDGGNRRGRAIALVFGWPDCALGRGWH